ASLENPSTTFAARGNAANFALGGPGNTGGLYNSLANYSFNATPDVIVKLAFEPGFGHYEVFAVGSRFRDRVYPCAQPPLGGCNGNPRRLRPPTSGPGMELGLGLMRASPCSSSWILGCTSWGETELDDTARRDFQMRP